MPSFTTIYRASVLIAVGVLVAKGWQHYGPPIEKVTAFAVYAVELAQAAWSTADGGAEDAADPRLVGPAPATERSTAGSGATPLALGAAALSADANAAIAEVAAPPLAEQSTPVAKENEAAPPLDVDASDRLSPLFARLAELGAADSQLAPWGASGQFYRFCCRAKLTETQAFARHFEAVAAEPLAAVEQVVAEVEQWHEAHGDKGAVH